MTRADGLRDLLAAVEAGTVNRGWFDQRHWPSGLAASLPAEKAYNGSVDAAIAFTEAVLPDEGWGVEWIAKYPDLMGPGKPFKATVGWGTLSKGYADNPARALLIAALKALIAQEEAWHGTRS